MTCNDCLHWEACKHMLEVMGYIVDGDRPNADKLCDNFKDKSRFVELPCKIGDVVYKINSYVWERECGMCEHYIPGGLGDDCECGKTDDGRKAPECRTITEEKVIYLEDILLDITLKNFGKTVFPTREAAEEALKEREDKSND